MGALNKGNWVSIALVALSCYLLVDYMLPETMQMEFFGEGKQDISSMRVFFATLVGLFVGGVISSITEYYTGLGKKPILEIVQKSSTGAGTNIIAGLATGMISTFPSVLLICCCYLGFLCSCRILRSCFSRFCNDGNYCYAVGD